MEARISDIMWKTGERILRAIVAGERDPERLASFRDSRIKPRADTLAAGLQGTWRNEYSRARSPGHGDGPRGA